MTIKGQIIALIRYQGIWHYYSASPDDWVLDIPAYEATFTDIGYSVPEPAKEERFGIQIVNESSAAAFIAALEPNRLSEQEQTLLLRQLVPTSNWFDVDYLFPKLLIDFDERRLVSVHVDGINYDRYVPQGWTGEFRDFYDEIPPEHRYWVDGDHDYLEDMKEKTRLEMEKRMRPRT